MRKIIIACILIAIALFFLQKGFNVNEIEKMGTSSGIPKPIVSETIEQSNTFVEKRMSFTYKDQKLQYLLIFPARYTQNTNQWPMILFLHGRSSCGQDLNLVKDYGPPWVAEQNADFSFVVLAPQCAEGENWMNKPDILAALLDDVIKNIV